MNGQQPYLQIVNQACLCCGAQLPIQANTEQVKCEYCGTELMIVRPIKVTNIINPDVDENEKKKFANFVNILENSMVAGNYREAYEYCNKALEIDPASSEIWENKAICTYNNATKADLVEEEAREVTTYLQAAYRCNSNSQSLYNTSRNISISMFNLGHHWLYNTPPDMNNGVYSFELCTKLLKYIKLWDICFQIFRDTYFLKAAVFELAGQGKLKWPSIEKKIPTAQLRNAYIQKILAIESNYKPPAVKTGFCFVATAVMGSYDHPSVLVLRRFRDDYLLKCAWGKRFVLLYYKYGHYTAHPMRNRYLRLTCKYGFILPFVFLIKECLPFNHQEH